MKTSLARILRGVACAGTTCMGAAVVGITIEAVARWLIAAYGMPQTPPGVIGSIAAVIVLVTIVFVVVDAEP